MATESTASNHRCPVRSWSDLPGGPLYTILTCLTSFVDFISFSSVCRSWRAVASSLSSSQITSFFPPLLCSSSSRFHCLSGLRLLDPASSLDCNFDNVASVGFDFLSSHGRLLRWSRENQIVILNPFTGEELCSPIIPKGGHSSSFHPSHTTHLSFIDSALLLFTSNTLFHWHIGSPTWSCHSLCIDLIFSVTVAIVKGKLYAMDCAETLFVLDLSPQLHLRQLAVDGIAEDSMSDKRFLVDCGGELLLIRLVETEGTICLQLEASRLDLSTNQAEWVKMETLGNWAIFVGHDLQVVALAVENPERWGGRSNCVYFATGNENGDWPWEVIKLGDEIATWDPKSPLFYGNYRHRQATSWVHPGF